jgi:hypothetical protein
MSKRLQFIKHALRRNRNFKKNYHGGIEHLMPGKITGWAISKMEPFHEVRLLAGPHLISRTDIDQPREDVINKYNYIGNPGFSLALPHQLPDVDWNQPIRLIALSIDGNYNSELYILNHPQKTRTQLQSLLQSESLGMDGHFDGIIQGALQGWAARKDQHKPSIIWLHCEGHESIPVICDQIREGMKSYGLPSQCGFRVRLEDIPANWKGLSVKCYFDRKGLFSLPQNEPVFMPLLARTEVLNTVRTNSTNSYQSEITSSCEGLRVHWEELEMLRLILNDVEEKLDHRDKVIAAQQQNTSASKSWFKRILGIRRFLVPT